MVPLRLGAAIIGVVYLDRPAVLESDLELLHLFANQAAVAIQNAQLYQMATLDLLTGVYVRRFFEQCLLREPPMHLAARHDFVDKHGVRGRSQIHASRRLLLRVSQLNDEAHVGTGVVELASGPTGDVEPRTGVERHVVRPRDGDHV